MTCLYHGKDLQFLINQRKLQLHNDPFQFVARLLWKDNAVTPYQIYS